MRKLIVIIFLNLLLFNLSNILLAKKQATNSNNLEQINIFDKAYGDFLDIDVTALQRSANEAYQKTDYEKAAKLYLSVLHYDIHDASSIYNLACCYGLLGKDELASIYLKRAVKAGFDDIGHIEQDKDFDKVKSSSIFKTAMDSIKIIVTKKDDPFLKKIYLPGNAFVPVYIHLPDKYDVSKKYTLIIGLHGFGDNAKNFSNLWKAMDKEKFIYACPEALYPMNFGKEIGYSWGIPDSISEDIDNESRTQADKNVAEMARKLKAEYNISETYLMGFSQGCGLTYTAGIINYDLFKGLICFGGWLDTKWLSDEQLKKANRLKIAIIHGIEDNVVKFENAEKANKKLTEMGYSVSFRTFKGGHQMSKSELGNALEWMGK
jgi:predicted esterase